MIAIPPDRMTVRPPELVTRRVWTGDPHDPPRLLNVICRCRCAPEPDSNIFNFQTE